MSTTTKLFRHGRSQAVRLPKEFRFEGKEVRVSKVGDKVILEPLKEPPPVDLEARFARLDKLGARDFLPDAIPDDPAQVWAKIDELRNGEDLFPEGGIDDPPSHG